MYKVYSNGHPYILPGLGRTIFEAFSNFIKNSEKMTNMRKIFSMTIRVNDILEILNEENAEKIFKEIQESGNYGNLILENE